MSLSRMFGRRSRGTSWDKRMPRMLHVAFLFGLLGALVIACSNPTPSRSPEQASYSLVEITPRADTMEPVTIASGQCITNDQVATVVNWEDINLKYGLDDLWIWGGQPKPTIQAIDPRTGVILLKAPGFVSNGQAYLKVAEPGDATKLKVGQDVTVFWKQGFTSSLEQLSAKVVSNSSASSLFFEIAVSKDAEGASHGIFPLPGATVADDQGRLLGLVGATYNTLIPQQRGTQITVQVVSINSIMKLLAPDAAKQPWASGPSTTTLATSKGITGYTSGILTTGAAYDKMNAAVEGLLGQLGRPLDKSELPSDYVNLVRGFPQNPDGNLLTLVYPNGVQFKDPRTGNTVTWDWIGLQWDRSGGKPNVLYYGGPIPYRVDGGFVITGDVTALTQSVSH